MMIIVTGLINHRLFLLTLLFILSLKFETLQRGASVSKAHKLAYRGMFSRLTIEEHIIADLPM